jgi:hypothetical protein
MLQPKGGIFFAKFLWAKVFDVFTIKELSFGFL